MNTFRFICSYNNQRGSYHAKEIEPKTKVVLDTLDYRVPNAFEFDANSY